VRPYRILVTGWRGWPLADRLVVWSTLRHVVDLYANGRPVIVVHGQCPAGGVDLFADQWATTTDGVQSERWPAAWEQHGRRAGPLRNGQMVDAGADICLVFPGPGSVGTWDCLRKAAAAGIWAWVVPYTDAETAAAF
jgi:hypothetical protein